jgi:hypothetical protein
VLEEVEAVAISILPSGGLAGCDDEQVLGLEVPSSGGERASVDAWRTTNGLDRVGSSKAGRILLLEVASHGAL